MYSLGCVLLEMAFWLPLHTILLQRLRSLSDEDDALSLMLPSSAILVPKDNAEYYAMIKAKQAFLEERGSGSIRAGLEFRMGIVYSELVMNCLNEQTQFSSPADEEFNDGLDFQERIVSTLRSMSEIL